MKIIASLTYLGALPFLILTIFSPYISHVTLTGFDIYTIVILSFLSGSYWGICLEQQNNMPYLLISNILAILIASIAYIGMLNLLSIVFLLCSTLTVDYMLYRKEIISQQYFILRKNITTIVFLIVVLKEALL